MWAFLAWLIDAILAVVFWLSTLCAADITIRYEGAPTIHLPGWSLWVFGKRR